LFRDLILDKFREKRSSWKKKAKKDIRYIELWEKTKKMHLRNIKSIEVIGCVEQRP